MPDSKELTLKEEYEQLQLDRDSILKCLDKISDTQQYGILLLLEDILSESKDFNKLPMGVFTDIVRVLNRYKNEMCSNRIELKGVREEYK